MARLSVPLLTAVGLVSNRLTVQIPRCGLRSLLVLVAELELSKCPPVSDINRRLVAPRTLSNASAVLVAILWVVNILRVNLVWLLVTVTVLNVDWLTAVEATLLRWVGAILGVSRLNPLVSMANCRPARVPCNAFLVKCLE